MPKYADMLTGDCVPVEQEAVPERIPFEKLEEELRSAFAEDEDGYYTGISKYTPMELALPVFNLWEGLLGCKGKKCRLGNMACLNCWRTTVLGC